MVMVTVEILEIEVLFCTYVWVTSYILMVEKAIKKGLFHTEQAFFYMHVLFYVFIFFEVSIIFYFISFYFTILYW